MYEKLRENIREKYDYWMQDLKDEDLEDFACYDLIKAIEESENFFLYKYMPANYFNIRNIETQKIHLTKNGVLNDIYEGLPSVDLELKMDDVNKLDGLAVMTCFTETNDSMLMWSHYANSHEGICVQYDLKNNFDDRCNARGHLYPVIYEDKRPIKRDISELVDSYRELCRAVEEDYTYDCGLEMDDILPLFLVKGEDWKYEKEWRIIYTKKQLYDEDLKELYSGNIKFECISAIYLGYRIHPEIRNNILEICRRISTPERKIRVYQAKLDNEKYKILFEEILDN